MKEETQIIKGFTLLRFPLAVFVIMIHSNYFTNFLGNYEEYNVDTTLYHVLKIIPNVAVPCFYIISGFFYFYQAEPFNYLKYKQKTKRRLKSLLIPYLLWNLITYIVLAVKEMITGTTIIEGGLFHFDIFLSSFWLYNGSTTPISAPLWFLKDLIIVVLFTPIIYKALKNVPFTFLIVLVLLFVVRAQIGLPGLYPAPPCVALLYFSIGAYISLYKDRLLKSVSNPNLLITAMLMLYVVGVIVSIIPNEYQGVAKEITMYVTGVALIVMLAYKLGSLPAYEKIVKLNPTCFFLFALHFLLINSVETIVAKLFPINSISFLFCLSVFFNVVLCMSAYYVCKRIMPSVTSMLSGGRI